MGWINKNPTFDKIKDVLYLLHIEGLIEGVDIL
jgi:hypothetical protein